jgi:hypothetical protein
METGTDPIENLMLRGKLMVTNRIRPICKQGVFLAS